MGKVLIFSHESDIDGLGSIVLGKMVFPNLDYVLVPNVMALENEFRSRLDNKILNQYEKIYITDLALCNPALDMVYKDPGLANKVLVFDHHKSAINDGLNKYLFTTIMEADDNGKKRCGTEMFYEYLCNEGLINKTKTLDFFVELTRLEDTWEWKHDLNYGVKAHDLAILFNGLGIKSYIDHMITHISNNTNLEFTNEEKKIVETKKKEYLALLQHLWSDAYTFVDEEKNSFGAVFANYEYRNELSDYVKSLDIADLKYLVVVALDKGPYGQKSYRSIADNFDVGKVAERHGGNGHPGAASVNITEEQNKQALVLKQKSIKESLEYLVNSSYSN